MRQWLVPVLLLTTAGCKNSDGKGTGERAPAAPASAVTAPSSPPLETADYGSARLKMEGAFDTATQTANAVAFKDGKRLKKLEIRTTDAYRRKEKISFIVQLTAPVDLLVEPGTYTVDSRAQAASATKALGATIIVHDDALHPYTWNPKGEVTFTEVDTHVRGRFRVTVLDRDPRVQSTVEPKVLTALGEFDAVLGEPPNE